MYTISDDDRQKILANVDAFMTGPLSLECDKAEEEVQASLPHINGLHPDMPTSVLQSVYAGKITVQKRKFTELQGDAFGLESSVLPSTAHSFLPLLKPVPCLMSACRGLATNPGDSYFIAKNFLAR